MNLRQLSGKQAIDLQGWRIDRVSDVVIDTTAGRPRLSKSTSKATLPEEFGMKKFLKAATVAVRVEHVQGVGDSVTLRLSKAQLKDLLAPVPRETGESRGLRKCLSQPRHRLREVLCAD